MCRRFCQAGSLAAKSHDGSEAHSLVYPQDAKERICKHYTLEIMLLKYHLSDWRSFSHYGNLSRLLLSQQPFAPIVVSRWGTPRHRSTPIRVGGAEVQF